MYWNSKSVPLTVYASGSAQAMGYGDWTIATTTKGTQSRAGGYLKDPHPTDGDPVYFRLNTMTNSGYCYQPQYTSCTVSWYDYAHDGGGEYWSSSSWSTTKYIAYTGVSSSGSYARAAMQVAEEHNNLPDIFSGKSYTNGIKY